MPDINLLLLSILLFVLVNIAGFILIQLFRNDNKLYNEAKFGLKLHIYTAIVPTLLLIISSIFWTMEVTLIIIIGFFCIVYPIDKFIITPHFYNKYIGDDEQDNDNSEE